MPAITHAVFAASGTQYRVKSGDAITVNRLAAEVGGQVKFDSVLLLEQDNGDIAAAADAAGAVVHATVTEHLRGEKLRVFKMRRRKKSRRTHGHRQELTRLLIGDIKSGAASA